jgi:SAM-dependent methyltransferase
MPEPHRNRARARSFGSVAALYDSHRPAYAEALFDDLAALHPAQVLDVGCGTGKVANALLRRGHTVLGVEPDEQMATVARGYGVPVDVATFENWEDGGRQFDLLTCGAAWHWIDPAAGLTKAARVTRSDGTLARFWNFEVPVEPVATALDAVYRDLAPGATQFVPYPPEGWKDPVAQSAAFCSEETRVYPWQRTLSSEQWVAMVTTFSDHQCLDPSLLAALQSALGSAIETAGGSVHTQGGTYLRLVRRT